MEFGHFAASIEPRASSFCHMFFARPYYGKNSPVWDKIWVTKQIHRDFVPSGTTCKRVKEDVFILQISDLRNWFLQSVFSYQFSEEIGNGIIP